MYTICNAISFVEAIFDLIRGHFVLEVRNNGEFTLLQPVEYTFSKMMQYCLVGVAEKIQFFTR